MRKQGGDSKAAKTLEWTLSEFARASKSSSGSKRLSFTRFQAALAVFRGSGPPCEEVVARILWDSSQQGKISAVVSRVFPFGPK